MAGHQNPPQGGKSRRRGRRNGSNEKPTVDPKKPHGKPLGRQPDDTANGTNYTPHKSLLIQLDQGQDKNSGSQLPWYQYGENLTGRNATLAGTNQRNSVESVARFRALADRMLRTELQLFQQQQANSSDERWIESTMSKGTLKDRIAATSVSISTWPVHKLYVLDGLLSMAGCSQQGGGTQQRNSVSSGNSRVTQLAAQAAVDLFVHTLLPPDRKLVTLDQRPLFRYEASDKSSSTSQTLSPRLLLLWRYEELLQSKFNLFLQQYLLPTLRHGAEPQKVDALKSASTLLQSVPEQEALLLEAIVNKLGDPAKKIAAAAQYELRSILKPHPAMKHVMAREVQQLTYRPHLSSKALYNAIIFLNQLPLESEESSKKKEDDSDEEEASSKPRSVAPTSLPGSLIRTYLGLFERVVADNNRAGGRTNHHKESPKKKSNKKPDEESSSSTSRALQTRLLSALLTGVNRARPYLPESDANLLQDHVDALYRVVHTAQPAAATQALLLLFHVVVVEANTDGEPTQEEASSAPNRARRDRFYRALYSTLSESTLVGSGRHLTLFFNLLYKAMKADTDQTRVLAFSKRLFCTTIHCSESVVAASLFLMNEISKTHPVILTCFEEILDGPDATRVLNASKREPRFALESSTEAMDEVKDDGNATVQRAPSWELSLSLFHYHPSVSKFASSMGRIEYSGDPLKDFALAPFLDKFAYRNPKSVERLTGKFRRGQSVAERRSGTENMMQTHSALPVNDPSFLEREHVDEQDEFFHKFFSEQARRDKLKGVVRYKSEPSEDDNDQAELDALDDAEAQMDEGFEAYEDQWETDSEEEAFVDSLAQKVIEDAIDGPHGPEDLDDEDPDMEGDEDDDDSAAEDADSGEVEEADKVIDDDAFMDASDSDSSGEIEGDNNEHLEKALDIESSEDDENQLDDEGNQLLRPQDDSDEDVEAGFLLESDSDQDETSIPHVIREESGPSVFADAAEYEERINSSWNELKRSRTGAVDDDDMEAPEPETSGKKKKRKKKKRRR